MDLSTKLIISRPLYLKDTHCGYCKLSKNSPKDYVSIKSWYDESQSFTPESITIGFQVESMTVEQYDYLINHGFRRSGSFLYRPDNLRTCCKMFTIRSSWNTFKLNKEMKQGINGFNKNIGNESNQNKKSFDLELELQKILNSKLLEIRYERPIYTIPKYELFVKYQNDIHKDFDTSPKSFKRFLCENPLPTEGVIDETNGSIVSYGAIHQCYYYKGKLIAIGFLDILPSGLSSIYFIYDPEYKHLELGKISGILELHLSKTLGLEYYYLGYYIDDCVKMKYKAKYNGELLDVDTFEYVKLDQRIHSDIKDGQLFTLIDGENVIEKKYGVDGYIWKDNNTTINQLNKLVGKNNSYDLTNNEIISKDSDHDTIYQLPLVLTGEIVKLKDVIKLDQKALDDLKFLIFERGIVRYSHYRTEISKVKKIIIDLIRLIGLELLKDSVILV